MKNNLSENENKVLEHLKKNTLTTLQAVTDLHIMNVQDVLMRLKDYGYPIDKEWKTKGKKRYAVYFML
jgi:predicted transcriptional regulator